MFYGCSLPRWLQAFKCRLVDPQYPNPNKVLDASVQFAGFAAEAGASMPGLLPEAFAELSPMMLVDNIAAM